MTIVFTYSCKYCCEIMDDLFFHFYILFFLYLFWWLTDKFIIKASCLAFRSISPFWYCLFRNNFWLQVNYFALYLYYTQILLEPREALWLVTNRRFSQTLHFKFIVLSLILEKWFLHKSFFFGRERESFKNLFVFSFTLKV